MQLFSSFKNTMIRYFKIFSLWDFQKDFSKADKLKLLTVITIDIVNSIAKMIAPAAFAKAIEMLALSKENIEIGFFELEPKELLYISAILSVALRSESYIKNIILNKVNDHAIKKNAMKIIDFEHRIPLSHHYILRTEITQSLMEILTTQSQLSSEVAAVLFQGVFDILAGSILIWSVYGKVIGIEFLIYCAFDFFILDNIVAFITKHSSHFKKMNKKLNKLMNREFEILNYGELIRMFNHEQLEAHLTEVSFDKYLSAKHKFQFFENTASMLKLIPYLIATIMPISFMIKEQLTLDDLDRFIFLITYINAFGGHVLGLSQSVKSCLRAIESIHNVKVLLGDNDYPLRIYPLPLNDRCFESPEVSFENVYFTYPKNDKPTLNGISFTLFPGKKLGIVGKSNAGKSTIVKLLFGFYQAQSGSIKINGIPVENFSSDALSRIFCCVPQTTEFFKEKSLKYNILYGNTSDVFLEEYLALEKNDEMSGDDSPTLQQADEIFSDVMNKVKLADLVDNKATEKGNHLTISGGQRQRASIARALVRNSKIFIFDEATSSLDAFAESEVLKNIRECTYRKSVMMISHRLSTIKDADEIIVIEDGKVGERGAPSELLGQRGLFYNYWQAQML
jgi:ABC-type multidrug transport system fused ATPase/permease subunit